MRPDKAIPQMPGPIPASKESSPARSCGYIEQRRFRHDRTPRDAFAAQPTGPPMIVGSVIGNPGNADLDAFQSEHCNSRIHLDSPDALPSFSELVASIETDHHTQGQHWNACPWPEQHGDVVRSDRTCHHAIMPGTGFQGFTARKDGHKDGLGAAMRPSLPPILTVPASTNQASNQKLLGGFELGEERRISQTDGHSFDDTMADRKERRRCAKACERCRRLKVRCQHS